MKKLFLSILVSLILCNTGFTRSTGCTDGDCNNGYGTWTYTDLTTYVGEWSDGKKHGKGTVTWPNGYIYVGEFRDSKWHGQGTLTSPEGSAKTGIWRNGEPISDNCKEKGLRPNTRAYQRCLLKLID